jgi:hypothetical protein
LPQLPTEADYDIAQQANLVFWNGYFINHDLFLIYPSLSTLPSPLTRRMDRKSSELSEQLSLENNDHIRGDGLALVVRQRQMESTRAQPHKPRISWVTTGGNTSAGPPLGHQVGQKANMWSFSWRIHSTGPIARDGPEGGARMKMLDILAQLALGQFATLARSLLDPFFRRFR